MFPLFKNLKSERAKATGAVGLGFLTDGIALAAISAVDGQVCLHHCGFYPCGAGPERLDTLKMLVDRHSLGKVSCHLVLAPPAYNLLQIEAPEVPDEEMKEAIPWCIQDMIDFPIDESVLDYFPLPNFNQPGGSRTITVAVARSETISDYTKLCEQAGVTLNVIDIQELALCNLAARLPENERGVALIYLQNNGGMIILEKDSLIYLSRKFETDINNIAAEQAGGGGLLQGNLALEIQRSLDYYERQFAMPPISGLVVSPLDTDMEGLFKYLQDNLAATPQLLDVSALLNCEHGMDETTLSRCLPAIGAALRNGEGLH